MGSRIVQHTLKSFNHAGTWGVIQAYLLGGRDRSGGTVKA